MTVSGIVPVRTSTLKLKALMLDAASAGVTA